MHCFLYHDGLARFATEDYQKNTDSLFVHLTNYAINKESEKFEGNEAEFKKTVTEVLDIIKEKEGQEVVDSLMLQMKDMIVKTLLIGWPHLDHNYRTVMKKANSHSNNR